MSTRMPSMELIHDQYERERDRDLRHFESLDTKAGIILGFGGVLAALTGTPERAANTAAVALAFTASLLALISFWPRAVRVVDTQRLREYLAAEERITRLAIVDIYLSHFEHTRVLLKRKAATLKWAMAALATSAAITAVEGIMRST